MSNGATFGSNPGGQSPPQSQPAQPPATSAVPQQYRLEDAPPQQPQQDNQQQTQIPQELQQELAELRALRERIGPMQNILQQMDGETLHQHFGRYAEMLQQQQRQPAQPQRQEEDRWGDRNDSDPSSPYTDPEINALRNEMRSLINNIAQKFESFSSNTGIDKVQSLRDKFLNEDFPGLAEEHRAKISQAMDDAIQRYKETPEGRNFLANPQYEAIRALGLRYIDRDTMEDYFRSRLSEQASSRARVATDSYQPTRGREPVDTDKLSFEQTWELSGTPEILAEFGRD